MEKIKSVCVMRDLVKAVAELQDTLQERLGISLNEAMVLCSIGEGTATAGEISRSQGDTGGGRQKADREAMRQ